MTDYKVIIAMTVFGALSFWAGRSYGAVYCAKTLLDVCPDEARKRFKFRGGK